ncbi:Atu4866 domain-containing protein [Paractinoplanes globisporus]|uniref:Atu4866 domain-containing protein n=1 Tax=Paractinoplanes globisporus TaxID=113565 RepID=A0ABW6WWI8_9ACTN|nr:Atu4866 domain-containing protein [Actinoplanes globisporus]
MRQHADDRTVLDATALLKRVMGGRPAERGGHSPAKVRTTAPVGVWLSEGGTVRLDIFEDGTYDGQVAGRKRHAHGTYHIDGSLMTLSDDSGLFTPVTLGEGELEMAGYHLNPAAR